LYKFAPSGLSAQAYRTATGFASWSFQTTTLLYSIFAFAQTNFLSPLFHLRQPIPRF
jgi:hypothetical protein